MKEKYKMFLLLLRPSIIAVAGAFFWYFLHDIISVNIKDQGIFESLLVVIGIAHGAIASAQIQKVNDQNQKIQQILVLSVQIQQEKGLDKNKKEELILKNLEQFKSYLCLRISPVIKMLLAVFSFVFAIIFLLYPFSTIYTGIITVWVTMFILYLLWEVAAELDDSLHGVWRINQERITQAFGEEVKIEDLIKSIQY